jgi:N-acetylneuraminate epimerase
MSTSPASSAPTPAIDLRGWKLLAPLPDPIGYGGMAGGVIGGRLVVAGGSNFPEKPFWLKGEKGFNDRIYTLASPSAKWEVLDLRLPEKAGAFACTAHADTIYLAGGIGVKGPLATVHALGASGSGLALRRLPDLPVAVGYAVAAVAGGHLVVAGGQTVLNEPGAVATAFALDLSQENRGWRRLPDLPGPGVFVGAAASDGPGFLLFGGMAFDADRKYAPSKRVYRFDPGTDRWERLGDLPVARVAAVSPCPVRPDGHILLVGGYAEVFPGAPREHPGFATDTWIFNPVARTWSAGPEMPRAPAGDRDRSTDAGPGPVVAAPGAVWQGHAVVISGEIRPATRTPAVLAWPLR